MSDAPLPPPLFGIWIPGRGWWRIGKAAYAEVRREVAEFYARWIGHRARVIPIDKSLDAGEPDLLALERERFDRSLRERLRRWMKGIGAKGA